MTLSILHIHYTHVCNYTYTYTHVYTHTGRIMELLQYKHRHLEQQRIGDMAIIPPKETRANIYSLYR